MKRPEDWPVEGLSHRMVRVGDLDVHVAEAGSGPPLILLHGWPQDGYAFRLLVPLLSDRYRLILPDLRGFGFSSAPRRGYDKEQLATDLLGLLDALGLDQVDLVGHDWGGWTGFLACLRAPHRFGHYVALNISHPWPNPSAKNIAVLKRFWYQALLSTPIVGRRVLTRTRFVETLIKSAAHQRIDDDAIRYFADRLTESARARASVRLYRRFLLGELGPVIAGRYADARLTVPTKVLLGAHDPAIRPELLGGYEAHTDALTFEVHPEAGHFLPEEQPEFVAQHIRAFCTG